MATLATRIRRIGRRIALPALFAAAIIVPPLAVALGNGIIKLQQLTPAAPAPLTQELSAAPAYDPSKPVAVVVMGNLGTEITDFSGPFTVLSASGKYNVYAVAPERRPSPMFNGGLDIVPHFSFAGYEQAIGKDPDLIVVPYIPNTTDGADAQIVPWIRSHYGEHTTILSICVGANVLAQTGLLDGQRSTIYHTWFSQVEREYPLVTWVQDVRWVDNGRILSSAGITSGIDASLHLLDRQFGRETALRVADELHYPHTRFLDDPAFIMSGADEVTVWLKALYSTGDTIGVALYNGVNELALSSIFDVYPGSNVGSTVSIAPDGRIVRSQHGLDLLPDASFANAPKLDRLLVPGAQIPAEALSQMQAWAAQQGTRPELVHESSASTYPYDATIKDVARTDGAPIAGYLATGLEYPAGHLSFADGRGYPFDLPARPLALALLGLGAAVWFTQRRAAPPAAAPKAGRAA